MTDKQRIIQNKSISLHGCNKILKKNVTKLITPTLISPSSSRRSSSTDFEKEWSSVEGSICQIGPGPMSDESRECLGTTVSMRNRDVDRVPTMFTGH
jgi:hypothetical protein